MATGTVKWFNKEKGYGFIRPDEGGTDVFVHIFAVQRSGLNGLDEGQRLAYEIVKDKRTGKIAADNLAPLTNGAGEAGPSPPLGDFEEQKSIATFFRVDEREGRLVPDLSMGATTLLNDADAEDRHAELLRLLTSMISSYDPSAPGANAMKFVVDDARLLQEALGGSIQQVRPGLLIPRGEVLRQIESQQETRGPDSDAPALGDSIRRSLRSTIAAYNHFVQLDPELARRDAALLDPGDSFVPITATEGLSIAHALLEKGVIGSIAIGVLETEARVAPAIPDLQSRNSRRFSESVRNLARAVVGKALSYVNSTRKRLVRVATVSTALVALSYGCSNWVVNNEVWLKNAFQSNPQMVQLIDELVDSLKKLPLA